MTSVWSLDNVFVGGSLMTADMLYETFDTEPSTDIWSFWPNGRIAEYCLFNTRYLCALMLLLLLAFYYYYCLLHIYSLRIKSTLNSNIIYRLNNLLGEVLHC